VAGLLDGIAQLLVVVPGIEHNDQAASWRKYAAQLGDGMGRVGDVVEHVHGQGQGNCACPER
jgi:hypothetical protein